LLYLSASGSESQHKAITANLIELSHQEKTYTKTRVIPRGGDGISNDVPWPIAPKNIVNDSNYFIEEGKALKFIVGDFSYSNGLGNLMFQYASLRSIARKEGARVVLPEECVLRRAFDLDAVFINSDTMMQLMIDYSDQTIEVKDCCRFQPLENLFKDGNNVVIVSGYLQSHRYFDKPNDFHLLTAQFAFLPAIANEASQIFENLNAQRMLALAKPIEGRDGENSLVIEDGKGEVFWVGVHVRHGMDITMHSRNLQYGHTAAPLEYFEKAMQEMRERHENVAFLICSDDIDWAARNFKEKNKGEFSFCQRGAPREIDIQLLASCDGLILSPGTFSWWAAWLSHSIEVLYYGGWPRVGSSLDRQLNKTEYYIDEWMIINV
ncbi:hypothetical protein PMAYCL1PPCAC_21548, partial [Pristionchus mayeri]